MTSFLAGACMMLVGVYQFAIIKHLPEPPCLAWMPTE